MPVHTTGPAGDDGQFKRACDTVAQARFLNSQNGRGIRRILCHRVTKREDRTAVFICATVAQKNGRPEALAVPR